MGPSPAQPPTSSPDRARKPDLGHSSPPVSVLACRHQALRGRGWDGRPVPTNSRDPRPQQELGCFRRERWGALCGGCPCVRLYEGRPHRPARGPTVGTCMALAHRHPARLHPLPWPQLKVSFRATLFVSKLIGNTFWQRETWHFGRLWLCAQAAGESPPQCCLQGGGQ